MQERVNVHVRFSGNQEYVIPDVKFKQADNMARQIMRWGFDYETENMAGTPIRRFVAPGEIERVEYETPTN